MVVWRDAAKRSRVQWSRGSAGPKSSGFDWLVGWLMGGLGVGQAGSCLDATLECRWDPLAVADKKVSQSIVVQGQLRQTEVTHLVIQRQGFGISSHLFHFLLLKTLPC